MESNYYPVFALEHYVLPFLSGPTKFVLSHSCAMGRAILRDFTSDFHKMFTEPNCGSRLSFDHGMCCWFPPYKAEPMRIAARFGRRDLCELAPLRAPTVILHEAARMGHTDLCTLALKWISMLYKPDIAIDQSAIMLRGAIQGNQREICLATREWLRRKRYPLCLIAILSEAAYWGHLEICSLVYEWVHHRFENEYHSHPQIITGSNEDTIFQNSLVGYCQEIMDGCPSGMTREAILNRYMAVWHFAYDQCPEDVTRNWGSLMLDAGAKYGIYELCILAHEKHEFLGRGLYYETMLENATDAGHRDLCLLAREWAIEDHKTINPNAMLEHAIRAGNLDLCILAHEWGVTNETNLIWLAVEIKRPDIINALQTWNPRCLEFMAT